MKAVDSNRCEFCLNEIDFVEHFFYHCSHIHHLWKHIETLILCKIGKVIKINDRIAMFGVQTGYNKVELKYINHLILIGKMCISMIKKTKDTANILIKFEQQTQHRKIKHT